MIAAAGVTTSMVALRCLLREGKKYYMTGWYDDDYVNVAGEWKFKSRRINIDSFTPQSES
jgi:hypothetical protein